jgi:hypothetical protein
MHLIEKVFVKARNYSRHFDTQKNLSQSHKEINRPIYEKALFELEDAITELIKEKVENIVDKHIGGKVKKIIKAQETKDAKKDKKDDKPPKNNKSEEESEKPCEGPLLTDGID